VSVALADDTLLLHGLRGRREGGVAVFRGIPYAQAPTGARRFAAPEPVGLPEGGHDARAFGPVPPQPPRPGMARRAEAGLGNCLNLNIWTPDPAARGLPVLLWLPGGGFVRADAGQDWYEGTGFARQGIVLVSVNYRVGVDGFAALDGAPANRGLLDQIAALQWVQRHIRHFGGDPAQVTLAGHSAGAGSVACLLGLPQARGLFHRAILQSPSVATLDTVQAGRLSAALAALLGVPATRAAFAALPVAELLRGVEQLLARGMPERDCSAFCMASPFRPTVDGALLRAPVLQQLAQAAPQLQGMDVLVGSNDEEMRFYLAPDDRMAQVGEAALDAFCRAAGLPPALAAAYPGASAGERLCALQSDYYYRLPALRIAELCASAGLRSFHYRFGWCSDACGGRMGAAHALEVPFVFDTLPSSTARGLAGSAPPAALAQQMHAAWGRFVREGTPGWAPFQAGQHYTERLGGNAGSADIALPLAAPARWSAIFLSPGDPS